MTSFTKIITGILLPAAVSANPIPLEFETAQTNQLDARAAGHGTLQLTTRGQDPYILLKPFSATKASDTHTVLAFDYFSPEGISNLTIFYGPPFHGTRQFAAGSLGRAESWLPHAIDLTSLSAGTWSKQFNHLRLDLGSRAGATIQIRNLQLRQPTAGEKRTSADRQAERLAKLERESRINAFYESSFSSSITSVAVDAGHVQIHGHASSPAHLLELDPHISIADHAQLDHNNFILSPDPGIRSVATLDPATPFQIDLPRIRENRDRTLSRWAIAEPLDAGRWKLRSHWKYATHLEAAAANPLPKLTPRGVKGMGGVSPRLPVEELVELGVHNITINIGLTGLLSTTEHPGWLPYPFAGRTWFINHNKLRTYDRLTTFAHQNHIVASAILLVEFSDSEFGQMINHPEADRAGHYAMPNFTNPDGPLAYEAAVSFLASRYAAPGAPHGRIANWIIHNEVGFGWEWTNMGKQPPMLFMDHYLRSMRLVHNVTRRHDPHARVFISLTHHWNNPADPAWKSYPNIDLLERLIASSKTEGDFAWGVAFHPYPQSLRNPAAWDDRAPTDDFDTPMITPKNIAVLDRWMHRTEALDANGNVRGVLLSEQGFNTRDYSEQNQRLQAAGFVYMWQQMRGLKSIEAFHNHRWVDSNNEGGLLLGLRKLPSNGRPYGDKKLAWDTYKALDTPQEKQATAFADDIIGKPK